MFAALGAAPYLFKQILREKLSMNKPREWNLLIGDYGDKGWNGPDIPWGSSVKVVELGIFNKKIQYMEQKLADAEDQEKKNDHLKEEIAELEKKLALTINALKLIENSRTLFYEDTASAQCARKALSIINKQGKE